jgi:transposase InsO family protein
VRLFRRAVRGFGAPRHLITDLGGEFSARAFAQVVRRLGTRQRFAAKDSLKATARLERFWRPLKEKAALYRLHLPLTRDDLEARLEIALLQGAVPAEAFLALEPAHLGAVGPPRARPGEGPRNTPFRIGHLDACSGRFPILTAA